MKLQSKYDSERSSAVGNLVRLYSISRVLTFVAKVKNNKK